jgi:hypothetical protein
MRWWSLSHMMRKRISLGARKVLRRRYRVRRRYSHLLSSGGASAKIRSMTDQVLERLRETRSPIPPSFEHPLRLPDVAMTGIRAPSFRSSANQPAADPPVPSAKPLAAARRYSRHGLAYNQYIKECVGNGRRPSREDDVAAMRAKLGDSVTKAAVLQMRRELAPPHWKEPGRPKTKKNAEPTASMSGPHTATGSANH